MILSKPNTPPSSELSNGGQDPGRGSSHVAGEPSSPTRESPTAAEKARETETGAQLERSAHEASDTMRRAASDAKREARERLDEGKSAVARAAEDTHEALDSAADRLSEQGHASLAQATSAISAQLAQLADFIADKSLDELARDARELGRRNPGLLIAGGVAIGFALTRFFKASAEHTHEDYSRRRDESPATEPTRRPEAGPLPRDTLHAPRL